MKATGIFAWVKDGELKKCSATLESTGIKLSDNRVLWRKLDKNGKPLNTFAEQSRPMVPWATGRWFSKLNGGVVLEKYPELKVETEKSKTMTDAEYIAYLKSRFEV